MVVEKYYKHRLLREKISYLLYDMIKKYSLGSFSVTRVETSKKLDSLKVFLFFSKKEESSNLLFFLKNKRGYIKKNLAKSSLFSLIPWIDFYEDSLFFI